jgi:DNA repair exonuclease SbcCD ATPase subunit
LSVSEPEIPKPDESVVETPSPNFLGDLEAQSKAVREELDTARQRLAVVEKQIADSAADRTDDEPLRQLKQTQDELAAAKQELAEEKYNYSTLTIISQQLNQQLETERADRQQVEAELAELQKRLDAAEQNPDSAIEPDPYIFLNWLKDLVKGKSRKPPQWEPTKADAEAILARARQS